MCHFLVCQTKRAELANSNRSIEAVYVLVATWAHRGFDIGRWSHACNGANDRTCPAHPRMQVVPVPLGGSIATPLRIAIAAVVEVIPPTEARDPHPTAASAFAKTHLPPAYSKGAFLKKSCLFRRTRLKCLHVARYLNRQCYKESESLRLHYCSQPTSS